ncbi:MAG: NADPH-dependent assimilatory sulfite reductase hemoprotein subunit [Candidatus Hydrogenedentota bacterium]
MSNELAKDLPAKKPTPVEGFKDGSAGLRGTIATDLAKDINHFQEQSIQLLKHHGTYQQDNRETRKERKAAGLGKDYSMMIRTKFPGGRLTAEQYLVCDDLAKKYGANDLRATSRQCFQFRGVVKGNLRGLLHDLNHLAKITSMGACGDVVRNTMAPPIADLDPAYENLGVDLQAMAQKISDHFLPETSSYFDLWLDDEKVTVHENDTCTFADEGSNKEEPIYGKTYLPRKFKIGLGTDFDNSTDVYTQDVGVVAVTENGAAVGFEIIAGGGLGYSHGRSGATYARSGTPVAFVQENEIIPLIEAIVKVQRDCGDRTNRKHARLKYTIDDLGLDVFMSKVVDHAGRDFPAPKGNIDYTTQASYLGWHEQTDGRNYLGVWIENGRIQDVDGKWRFKAGLRAIIEKYKPGIRLTAMSKVILHDIDDADVESIQAMLGEYGIPSGDGVSALRSREMACPALPMCPLATSEAERALPDIMTELEEMGHGDADVVVRMSGCPNGCPRPVSAEIGLVGKGTNQYCFHVGSNRGSRFNEKLYEVVRTEQLAPVMGVLFTEWKSKRDENESFGDWSHKAGLDALRTLVDASGVLGE